LEIIFTLADFNDDGVLRVKELKASFEALGRPYWNKGLACIDTNGDRKIDAQEFVTAMENYWQFDALMDTYLEHCEATLLSLLEKRLHFKKRSKNPRDLSTKQKTDRRHKMLELLFTLADFNDDGVVRVKELEASFGALGRPCRLELDYILPVDWKWTKGLEYVDTKGKSRIINAGVFATAIETHWGKLGTLIDEVLEDCEAALASLLKKRMQFKERSKNSRGDVSAEPRGKNQEVQKMARELAFLRTVRRQSIQASNTSSRKVKQATEAVTKCEPLPPRARVSVYLSKNDKTDTVWGKYNAFFQNGTVYLRLVYQKNYAESMKLCPLPDEFYFSPTQDLRTIRKGKSRNLRNVLHPASMKKSYLFPKCPIYSLRMMQRGERQTTVSSYVIGVELRDQDMLEKQWSTAAIETLSRKFIADTATRKDFKVFTNLWKRYR